MRKEIRKPIDFFEIAKKYFLLLKNKFKFRCGNANVMNLQKVDLQSKKFTIIIYHNCYGFEVETIYQIKQSKKRYALYKVFETMGFVNDNLPDFVGVSTEECMEKYFSMMVKFLNERFIILSRVSEVEKHMAKIDSELIKNVSINAKKERYKILSVKAEEAWQKKQYEEVIKIYNEIDVELTQLEKKRLEYSKKQLDV